MSHKRPPPESPERAGGTQGSDTSARPTRPTPQGNPSPLRDDNLDVQGVEQEEIQLGDQPRRPAK